ncbi:MAG: hypothetical protein ACREQP_18855, partial [Candidatus Binatia bacterium]
MKKESPQANQSKAMIGELLVKDGLITQEQLEEAVAVQKKQQVYMPLGEICVDLKFISREQLKKTLGTHQKRIALGELLINLGLVTP